LAARVRAAGGGFDENVRTSQTCCRRQRNSMLIRWSREFYEKEYLTGDRTERRSINLDRV
jgi:hypothetical protein